MGTLAYAILGLLAAQSLSGYDLSRKMRLPVGLFWPARHSQIYPELFRLEAQGLVSHKLVEQQERPDKKVYSITPTGLQVLREWLRQPPEVSPLRDELILKVFNLWVVIETQEAIALLKSEEKRHRQQQVAYEKMLQEGAERLRAEEKTKHSPSFGSYLTLNWGIQYEAAYAEWCRWVIEELEKPE